MWIKGLLNTQNIEADVYFNVLFTIFIVRLLQLDVMHTGIMHTLPQANFKEKRNSGVRRIIFRKVIGE